MHSAVPRTAPAERVPCELADIFRRYGEAYLATHALTPAQRKAAWAILHCRTAALGGHREWCPACGFQRYTYHSCRNRHCPKCQSADTAAWVAARQEELLPVPYFHDVFTLPHEFNPLILYSQRNQRALLGLLFDATAQTLLAFGQSDLGGKVGFTLVLHTWDQRLRAHFHLHCLIASGALSNDGSRWIAGGRQFLFPVHGLSKMFRGKYLDGLAELLRRGQLDLPPQLRELAEAQQASPLAAASAKEAVGGVFPGALCRPTQVAGLPRPLYPSRGDRQPPPPKLRGRSGALPLPRPPRWRPAQNGRTACRGVLAPLLAACAAGPLPSHPPLRPAGQPRQTETLGRVPDLARHSTTAGRRTTAHGGRVDAHGVGDRHHALPLLWRSTSARGAAAVACPTG